MPGNCLSTLLTTNLQPSIVSIIWYHKLNDTQALVTSRNVPCLILYILNASISSINKQPCCYWCPIARSKIQTKGRSSDDVNLLLLNVDVSFCYYVTVIPTTIYCSRQYYIWCRSREHSRQGFEYLVSMRFSSLSILHRTTFSKITTWPKCLQDIKYLSGTTILF